MTVSREARGFALPVVLLTLLAITAIAASIIPKGAGQLRDAEAAERRVREQFLIDAGIARGILAVVDLDDPMTEQLRQGTPVIWAFADHELSITMHAESAKLDLNAADPGALSAVLGRALGVEHAGAALSSALAQRGHLTSPEQILPLIQRFSHLNAQLRDVVTVFGGQTEEPARTDGPLGQPTEVANERPVYTVRSRIVGRPRARAVTIMIDPESRRYAIVERVDLLIEDRLPDQ